MDFRNLGEVDLKLALLSGDGMALDNLVVHPYTMKEIREYGYEDYMNNLQWLNLTVDDFIKSTDDLEKRITLQAERSKLKSFDFFTVLGSSETAGILMGLIAMIFKTKDVRMLNNGVIAIDFEKVGIIYESDEGETLFDEEWMDALPEDKIKLVHRENFDEIVRIVKFQNFLSSANIKKQEFNPANEEARKLAEQMERNRQKVEAKKKAQQANEKGDDDEIDISDIISAVTAKSNSINKFNVWDLTLYQLYDEYSRLELIDNYNFNIKAMMAGVKEVDLKHWSSKI
jgi:hypothetical protein